MSEDKEVKFNAGMASAITLRELLNECNRYSQACRISLTSDGDMRNKPNIVALNLWRCNIRNVYAEIEAKLVKKDKKKIVRLKKKYKNKKQLFSEEITESGTYSKVNVAGFLERVSHFRQMELLLRELADSKGLLNPTKDDSIDETPEDW